MVRRTSKWVTLVYLYHVNRCGHHKKLLIAKLDFVQVCGYARNTPGSICQYKEDGLVSRPPSLFTSMHRPMRGTSCPKSQLKSTCLTAKFGSFLDHAETGEKGQNMISSSVQHLISLIGSFTKIRSSSNIIRIYLVGKDVKNPFKMRGQPAL